MTTEFQNVLIAALFCAVMLHLNLKTGSGRHWSTALLRIASFWLLVAGVTALAWFSWLAVIA